MRAKFFCRTGDLTGTAFEFADEATFGRRSDNRIVAASDPSMHRLIRIAFDTQRGCYVLETLDPQGGVRLDGMAVSDRTSLGDLHVVTLADRHDFIFQALIPPTRPEMGTPAQEPASGDTLVAKASQIHVPDALKRSAPPAESSPKTPPSSQTLMSRNGKISVPDFLKASPTKSTQDVDEGDVSAKDHETDLPHLELSLAGQTQVYRLREGEQTVGRSVECDIILDDVSVSRKHAVLNYRSGTVTVKDLGSVNATFLDERIVGAEVEVRPDGALRFGRVRGTLRFPANAGRNP